MCGYKDRRQWSKILLLIYLGFMTEFAPFEKFTFSLNQVDFRHPTVIAPFSQDGFSKSSRNQAVVIGTFRDSKLNLDEKKLDSIASHLIQLYETSMCWQQSYGALGLLSYLRNHRIPLGVISNFDPRLNNTLVNTKLRHYFSFVIGSYEVGVEKPHPQIFEKAMEHSKLENLQPSECLHIGNTALLDYKGARDNGWSAILIQDKDVKVTEKYPCISSKYIFPSLYNLHQQFLENNSTKTSNKQS